MAVGDYDEYIVKVPRRDKDGNDISDLAPESGGRRRDDGTLAALATDFRRVPLSTEEDVEYSYRTTPQDGGAPSVWIEAAASIVVTLAGEVGKQIVVPFVRDEALPWIGAKTAALWHRSRAQRRATRKRRLQVDEDSVESRSTPVDRVESAQPVSLTREQFEDGFRLMLSLGAAAEQVRRTLASAQIVDHAGVEEVRLMPRSVGQLSPAERSELIDELLGTNPELATEWRDKVLNAAKSTPANQLPKAEGMDRVEQD